ncbi:MAG TPA: TlyA family rRNA (cytidine-2'-O)-methyltransferase [Propionibacteriaceae bacterium]|nr:TlyA family RNA methyltransferase [Micropruina sp.]HBX81994.1 TlyA family rRNA (cytidine-2'-O)-methyltransferase [Propionibacteriaceae bacterium]HBY24166.1 TlyA family rRNA (cytidine-2'-O)-methyltransferase [Propionibacteriaceae bacterium]
MRLDVALVERGLARSRSQAKELITTGRVAVDGATATKPALEVPPDANLGVTDPERYVSRAANKLLGALADTGLEVSGRALDAGASTGGFTQVLLERGVHQVFAVDVGHDQLDATLREDPRVVVSEGRNVRDLTLDDVAGESVDLLVGDLSFISLRLVLPQLLGVVRPDGRALLLVKPQFEVGRRGLDGPGVVRDPAAREAVVDLVAQDAEDLGWRVAWRGPSRLPGPKGNVEFFLLLERA